jgi:3-oxoacyl-[acyl-carrier-protein] synthase-1
MHWHGRAKIVEMLRRVVVECLAASPDVGVAEVPLLLCLAEEERPGRLAGLDSRLVEEVGRAAGVSFDRRFSEVILKGRAGVAFALMRANALLEERAISHVLIAAGDSLLVAGTLTGYVNQRRLLTERNSNGFIPGEAAGALLVSRPTGPGQHLLCEGIGVASETAPIGGDAPLRADGLTHAMKTALADAGCAMHEIDFRIADLSGEHYYFKEATLALSRTLRTRKEEFDLWHPADCIGEVGSAAGVAGLTVAWMACRKSYAPGARILCQVGNDAGDRGVLVLRWEHEA